MKRLDKSATVIHRNKLTNLYGKMYRYISRVGVIERYLFKIKKVYMLIYPADEFSIIVKTMKVALKAWITLAIILFVTILIGKMHIYGYIIVITMLVVINNEIVNANFSKTELKLLRQLEEYLGDVRHSFHMNGVLEDAIYDSMEDAKYEVSLHISKIYDILTSNDGDGSQRYKDIAPNKYFMTFLALCETVMMFGDTIKDGESLFLENLNSLRDEVRTQILKMEKINYVFSGLTAISVIPPFTLKIIEKWGISNIPELVNFYDGRYGMIMSILICLISLCSYSLIGRLKENYRYREKSHSILEYITEIPLINDIAIEYMFRKAYKIKRLDDKLRRASMDIKVMQFVVRRVIIGISSFTVMLVIMLYGNTLTSSGVIKIPDFSIWMIPMLLCISYLAAMIPDIMLDIRMVFLSINMEDEVLSFHSIIIMLMHINRMSVDIILEWMENFAEIFKSSLSECVDNYTYDNDDALDKLEEMEPYAPFVRIVENLRASDNVGIEKAFAEIYSQRSYFIEKRKQDNEINISNKGAIGRFIAFIPMIATIGFYLIIPFVLQSMSELMGYVTQIKGL